MASTDEGDQVRIAHPGISSWLVKRGLNLQAVFELDTLPDPVRNHLDLTGSGAAFRQLLLFGHGGNAFWQALCRAGMAGEHPVDRFSVDCVNRYMQAEHPGRRYQVLYPGTARIPLQTLGQLAGWHHASPMLVGINHRWGVWFAYRVALLADTGLPATPPWLEPSPCDGCGDRPCVSACPAAALQAGRLQLGDCLNYRRLPDSLCAAACLARQACPVAVEHRYSDGQIRYHYGRSLEMILLHEPQTS
jgi:epoxyqueuosine reductase